MSTDDRTETITDRAAIRASDEPDERTPNEVHVDESGCSCKTGPYRGFQRDPIDAACPKHGEPLRHGDGDVTVCHPDGSTTIIREPDERGDFPYYDLGPATSETVGALDLDGIEAWARSEDDERLVLNLVTEVRRLTEEVGRCRAHRTLEQRALANALPLIARAEAAEAERDALRARLAAVEALADQWADRKRSDGMSGNAWIGLTLSGVAADLRAALATAGEGQ